MNVHVPDSFLGDFSEFSGIEDEVNAAPSSDDSAPVAPDANVSESVFGTEADDEAMRKYISDSFLAIASMTRAEWVESFRELKKFMSFLGKNTYLWYDFIDQLEQQGKLTPVRAKWLRHFVGIADVAIKHNR